MVIAVCCFFSDFYWTSCPRFEKETSDMVFKTLDMSGSPTTFLFTAL